MAMNAHNRGRSRVEFVSADDELSGLIGILPESTVVDIPKEEANKLSEFSYRPINVPHLQSLWKDRENGRRVAPRFKLTLDVLIVTPHKAFRTQTENISATGLLLKDLLPESFSSQRFEILLILYKSNGKPSYLLFRGTAVDNPMRTRRVRFEFNTRESEARLNQLLARLTPAA